MKESARQGATPRPSRRTFAGTILRDQGLQHTRDTTRPHVRYRASETGEIFVIRGSAWVPRTSAGTDRWLQNASETLLELRARNFATVASGKREPATAAF